MVPLKWMTGIFVTGDVIAFVMQAAGMSRSLSLPPSFSVISTHILHLSIPSDTK